MLSVQVIKCTIKLLPLLGQDFALRAIKELNEQIATAVLNIGRCYNTYFHTCVATPSSVYGHIDCSNVLHGSGFSHEILM